MTRQLHVRGSLLVLGLLAVGFVPTTTTPAGAAPADGEVTMLDNRYSPSSLTVAQGQRIEFQNFGMVAHDARDGSGLEAFATDVLGSPESETVGPLPGAGTYRYYCSFHPEMAGRLRVPVRVSRAQSPSGAAVTVRWSPRRARSGLVFDVQRRRPGIDPFVPWRTGVTEGAMTVHPTVRGLWRIRARVRLTSGDESSAWSPVRTLRIT